MMVPVNPTVFSVAQKRFIEGLATHRHQRLRPTGSAPRLSVLLEFGPGLGFLLAYVASTAVALG